MMKIYVLAGVVAVILLVAHLSGLDGYYYLYDWYDIPMHVVGGIALALFAYALAVSSHKLVSPTKKNVLLGVILIGAAWELFEGIYGIAGAPLGTKAYYVDTIKDLINDTIGAYIGVWIASRIDNTTHNVPK